MSFQRYEYKELVPTGEILSPAKRFAEPKLETKKSSADADASHRGGETGHFALDNNVAGHLGIHERMRQDAENRIQQELQRRWEQASEKAEVEGYTRGLEEGKAEAIRAEQPRIAEKLDRLDAVLQEMDSFRDRIFHSNEAFLMELVARVAGMVALKAVETDPDYLRRLITVLLQQLATKDDLKIFLAAEDAVNIEDLRVGLEKEFGKLNNTSIELSPEVQAGGCKIETRFGVVDASLNTQIQNVMASLKG